MSIVINDICRQVMYYIDFIEINIVFNYALLYGLNVGAICLKLIVIFYHISGLPLLCSTEFFFYLLKDRQQLDDYNIDFLRDVIKRREAGTFAWEAAILEVLAMRNLSNQLFNDNSSEKKAHENFINHCNDVLGNKSEKAVDDYFAKFVDCTDFFTSIGQEESAKLLQTLEEIIIKATAFDYFVKIGKI